MIEVKPVIVGEVGSFAHGINIETSDHDYHGIYIESQDSLLGLAAEQGVVRDREAGVERAKPGQKETTLFPLRQYVRMITDGNPTAFPLMYTPILTVPDQIDIQFIRHDFLSKRLIPRHMGYADKVIEEFTGRRRPSVNRPELVQKHGYDTKHAYHAVRLLLQGAELLTMGLITMPMQAEYREMLLSIRRGGYSKQEVIEVLDELSALIEFSGQTSSLPDYPDYGKINDWLIHTHNEYWSRM